jgi:hypothetical protein
LEARLRYIHGKTLSKKKKREKKEEEEEQES